MKPLFVLLFTFSMVAVQAGELKSFDEILHNVEKGKKIRAVINFDECSPTPPVANIRIFTAPVAIMMRKDYLQFSNSPLTTNNPKFSGEAVIENCTYKIMNTNEVKIVSRTLKLPDYKVVSEMTSVCPLSSGIKFFN
jgi:hypothetical protein